MTKIEMDIPDLGKKAGTLAWLGDYLHERKLVVDENDQGIPSLYLENEDGKRKFLTRPVASLDDEARSAGNGYVIREVEGRKMKVVPLLTSRTGAMFSDKGLFGVLTNAAKETAQEWLDQVVRYYAKRFEGVDDPMTVTVEEASVSG